MNGPANIVPLRFRSASRTHSGLVRGFNEDRVLDRPDRQLWAIADGMGGHGGGDVAAALVVDALASVAPMASGYARLAELTRQINRVNAELFKKGSGPHASCSGATLVALLAQDGHYACVWAGDSRAYLYQRGGLVRITRDHSIIQDLVDHGLLDDSARYAHPRANIVTRAVGASEELDIERRFAPIGPNDAFLLCSDGLTTCLDDDHICRILSAPAIDHAADDLLAAALSRGAPDNVSFIIVRCEQGGGPEISS